MERRIERLVEEGRPPACVIMEAAMMNLGVVLPEPGYLEAVREHHAQARHRPHLRRGQDRPLHRAPAARPSGSASCPTWSRWPRRSAAACRPARSAAPRRSSRSSRTARSTRSAPTTGTRSPMAAARASLLEVLTPDAYAHLDALNDRILARLPEGDREVQPARLRGRRRLQGLRHVLADEDRRLRVVQGEPGRRAGRPRLALQHEPRRLHDARAARRSGRCRSRTRSRTATPSSPPSRRWPRT